MSPVCLDTCILIYATQDPTVSVTPDLTAKAQKLLEYLGSQQQQIIVPTIVLGEFLLGIPEDKWGMTLSSFGENIMLAPYDVGCAQHFARLWQKREQEGFIDSLKNDGNTRAKLRADCMIIATALRQNASAIYSSDDGLRKFADDRITVVDIPDIPMQMVMPLDS